MAIEFANQLKQEKMKEKVSYSIRKYRGWYYVEKQTGKVKKYWTGSKWITNVIKAESYQTYQLANEALNKLSNL